MRRQGFTLNLLAAFSFFMKVIKKGNKLKTDGERQEKATANTLTSFRI